MLFRIYGCLVVHEKCIFRKYFSVGLSTGVNWFPFLFYLKIPIFWKTEREPRERETRPRAERERERERGDDRFAIRLRLHRSTSNPFDFAVRLHLREPRFIVPDCDLAFAPIAIAVAAPIRHPRLQHPKTDRPRPQNRSSSLSSFFSQFDRIMIFFSWVLFVFLNWGMKLYICLASEKRWENVFSVWFWFLLLWWCDGGVLVVVAFDCRCLLPWVEFPCEKFVGK